MKKTKSFLNEIYDDDIYSLSEIFHENTKLRRSQMRKMATKVLRISRDPVVLRAMSQSFKRYPNLDRVAMPKPLQNEGVEVEAAILGRRSTRAFDVTRPITIEQVSKLLHFSSGITGQKEIGSGITHNMRAAPSGGGLYPLEVYPCLLNIEGANRGIYHYNVKEHSLELLKEAEAGSEPAQPPFGIHTPLENPAAIFVLTAVFRRTTFKYSDRGYRLILIEAGHIVENFWLVATAMKLGAVALFSFLDDEVNTVLGLDGVNEAVVYAVAVGNPILAESAPLPTGEGAPDYD
jgi:SagB-type dehydrogenase family enzyme